MQTTQSHTESNNAEQEQYPVEPDTYADKLRERTQWMNWFYGDERRKIPAAYYSEAENQHSEKVRENWTNFENAHWWMRNRDLEGITFVLTEEDPFLVIDGDDVRDPETGKIHPAFVRLLERAQSYADVSVSGTGIHIILHESLPEDIGSIPETPLPEHEGFPDATIEVYDHGQHITMSGDHLTITPNEVRCNPEIIDDTVAQYKEIQSESNEENTTDDERAPVEAEEHDERDKPDEWLKCYYAGLRARERVGNGKELPGDSPHFINFYTAQIGIHAGLTVDEITKHFEEYYPPEDWDEGITRKTLNRVSEKYESGQYDHAPGVSKLYRSGILSKPVCDCKIHGESTGTYNPPGPSIHALRPEQRQEVSGSGIMAVSEALEALHVASAKEISEWTGYSAKQTYRILDNDDWRRTFESIDVGGTSYWHGPVTPARISDNRLAELPMSLSEYVQVFSAGRENVDTDERAGMIDALCENGTMTTKEIAESADYSVRSARRNLNELANSGLLLKFPGNGGNRYRVHPELVETAV